MTFRPGQSGNPAGRSKGAGEVGKLRAQLAKHAPDAISKLVELVKAGDTSAMRLYFDRVLPALKPEAAAGHVDLNGTLSEQARQVVAAAARSDISIDTARDYTTALAQIASIEVVDELRRKLDEIEHGGIA